MSAPTFISFCYPEDSSICTCTNGASGCSCASGCCSGCSTTNNTGTNPVFTSGLYNQLETDTNNALLSRYLASLDQERWNLLSNEIATLVDDANIGGVSAGTKSLIYGRIMIIITAQYLPVVSDFLGDQIAEQAATENIASDISAFLLDAQNGFNSLCTDAQTLYTATTIEPGSDAYTNAAFLFDGVMGLVGNDAATQGEVGTPDPITYDFSFVVNYLVFDATAEELIPDSKNEQSVLSFLTDTNIWGDITPISSTVSGQISSAMDSVIAAFNAGTTQAKQAGTDQPVVQAETNAWVNANFTGLNYEAYWWQTPYGATSYQPIASSADSNVGEQPTSGDAPLVYTQSNTVQENINQAAESVQTIATSTQTVENFQIQEIDQFYGIINSIQQSQEQQCAAIVKKQGNG
ncbi:MAG: hypothetical protein FJZ58_01690 [Chlamydiae bacterium]|nr:hypothetical protein [Chlamydiota bacterium]